MNIYTVINGSTRRLAHIKRYSSMPVNRTENVAEHTFFAMITGHAIAMDLKSRGYVIDPALVLEKLLYHDTEESLTGDIMRSFKYSTPELASHMKAAGDEAMQRLVENEYGEVADIVLDLWKHAKDDDTIEGEVAQFSDLLTVVAYLREEILSGNSHLERMLPAVYDHMKTYQDHAILGNYWHQVFEENDCRSILRDSGGLVLR